MEEVVNYSNILDTFMQKMRKFWLDMDKKSTIKLKSDIENLKVK